LGELGTEPGITWYDVLGVLPSATVEQVQYGYDVKVRLLRPELVAGAPSPVIAAASRACEILGTARRVLADPANRARYDETAGIHPGRFPFARVLRRSAASGRAEVDAA
jgi:curved DNA-binding protein CbpA